MQTALNQWERLPYTARDAAKRRIAIMRRVEQAVIAMWPRAMIPGYVWFNNHADVWTDLVEEAQAELVGIATDTIDAQLAEQGYTGTTELSANPDAFIGATGTGQPVIGLAYAQALRVTQAQENPEATYYQQQQAWNYAGAMLLTATQTVLADTSRIAKLVQATARPGTAMIRVVRPPCCARCAILAGKVGINVGFRRHPNCDCDAVAFANYHKRQNDPTLKNYMFDVNEYFNTLDEDQQNKIFTKAGAQAIRDGADPAQVVNARRGMLKASEKSSNRAVYTDEGTTKRGWASMYLRQSYNQKMVKRGGRYARTQRPRLMPEEIYRITGGDPDWSLSMLHAHGYLLDASPKLDGKRSWFPRDAQVVAARDRATAKIIARHEQEMRADLEFGKAPPPLPGVSRKGSKRTKQRAADGVNPTGDTKNCVRCVNAWALRKNGYDAHAVAGQPGMTAAQSTKFWKNDEGKTPKWEIAERAQGALSWGEIQQEIQSYDDGSFGFVRYKMPLAPGSHVLAWELRKGTIRLVDPQDVVEDNELALEKALPGSIRWVRIDGYKPTVGVVRVVKGEEGGKAR